jgi:hypothetical protein
MQTVRHRDTHGVNVIFRQQVLVIAKHTRNFEPLRQRLASVGVETRQRHDLGSGLLGISLKMEQSGSTTDHTDPQLFLLRHATTSKTTRSGRGEVAHVLSRVSMAPPDLLRKVLWGSAVRCLSCHRF